MTRPISTWPGGSAASGARATSGCCWRPRSRCGRPGSGPSAWTWRRRRTQIVAEADEDAELVDTEAVDPEPSRLPWPEPEQWLAACEASPLVEWGSAGEPRRQRSSVAAAVRLALPRSLLAAGAAGRRRADLPGAAVPGRSAGTRSRAFHGGARPRFSHPRQTEDGRSAGGGRRRGPALADRSRGRSRHREDDDRCPHPCAAGRPAGAGAAHRPGGADGQGRCPARPRRCATRWPSFPRQISSAWASSARRPCIGCSDFAPVHAAASATMPATGWRTMSSSSTRARWSR